MTVPTGCANTFLIGAQKSGTTYLASLLGQHPDVCVSDPKEPHFYSKHFDEGFAAYAKCFDTPDAKIRLDASTTYTFLRPKAALDIPDAPGLLAPVPQRIKEACPEARFIYIMRDPVKRIMSAVRHGARSASGPQDAPLSLSQVIEDDPMALLVSRYADQIERYLDVFERDRFLFLSFDDLKNDPNDVLARVCSFLDMAPFDIRLDGSEGEKHSAYQYTLVGRVLKNADWAKTLARRSLPKGAMRWLKGKVMTAPSDLEFKDLSAAEKLLSEDRKRVAELTGLTV